MQRKSRWAYGVIGLAVTALVIAKPTAQDTPTLSMGSMSTDDSATDFARDPSSDQLTAESEGSLEPVRSDEASFDTSVPEPATPAARGSFTIAVSGDILPHSALLKRLKAKNQSLDIDGAFEEIRKIVGSVDLGICHIEGALMYPGESIRPRHQLGTPPIWLREVRRAGYDRCSTASNHSLDGGAKGIDATVSSFDEYGLGQSGSASSAGSVLPEVFKVNGIKVAHLSYAYGFDSPALARREPWRANKIDPARIVADAKAMRAKGAEVVILSLHWGNSQWIRPSAYQQRVAEAVTRSGQVDLIVGHHAHVVQPISQVNGVWVVWGLGDFISNHPANPAWGPNTQDGVIVTVRLTRQTNRTVTVDAPVAYPTWCDKGRGYRIRLAAPGQRAKDLPASLIRALDASYRRTKATLGRFVA